MGAGNYVVTVTDANGCTATASVTITQPPLLTVSITATKNVSCFGGNNGTATSVAAGGTGPYAYIWTPTGGNNAIGTGLSAGNYTVTVTDANGCSATNGVTIGQPLSALTVTTAVVSNVLCNGNANGSAIATASGGTNPYTYLWTPTGGTNSTGTGMTAGTYTITVTDNNGCTATSTAVITQPAVLTATISAQKNVTCNGSSNGTATVTGAGGTLAYAYVWNPSGGNTATGTGLSAGTYSVIITDANGCTATAVATITQPALLTTSVTATNVSCFGGNNGTITTTTVGGTNPYAYLWSNGQTTPNATNLTTGTYSVTVTDANGCTATASASVTEPTKLVLTATGPQSVCSGAPATLVANVTGGTAPYLYAWTPAGGTTATTTTNPVSTTTYTITVTDANGCIITANVTVIVSAPLSLLIAGKSSTCPGGSISLNAAGSGGDGVYSYVWLPSNQTTQTVSFTPTQDSTVIVELTDGCGSAMQTVTIPITVDPVPKVSFSSDVVSGCIPLCIQFRDLTTLSSGSIYQMGWSFGNGDSSSLESPIICYKDTGTLTVTLTVTTDSGCSSTLRALNMITAYPPPNANFTYSPQPVNIMSPKVQFTDLSTGKYQITDWFWSFGEGKTTSTLRNPEFTYKDTGTFCPQLIITDVHGCVDSITNCFVVNPQFTFYIPDAFSPNGDGINDVFMPKGSYFNIKTYEMYIFDRWGMVLFHTTDINTGWNGTVKNGSLISQEDTYVYLINVTDTQGNNHSYTGNVNLVK
jgi:gliding motility-associated-like protein